jgi:lipopolysaccharide/colanic/teichoic acid biosynthesis glycosyltransferase
MVLGSTMTVAALPMLIPVACGLWIRKRRAFRSEIRCGRSGKTFSMLRFNVDRHVIHESRFDELLEILSISELPQLWNVIRGDMSLVGPRPEPPAAVSRYSDWHQQRLKVKPGMTGLAQVHGLRDENSSEQKARFDLQYLMNPSILADLSLLLQTVWTLATRLVHYSESTRRGLQRNLSSSNAPSLLIQEALSSAHSTQSSAD